MTPDNVFAEVDRVMSRPWDWSRDWHCFGDAADVFLSLWGVDPMAGVRGKAASLCAALRVVRGAGGMASMLRQEFTSAGLVEVPQQPGAVCIAPTKASPFGNVAAAVCITPGLVAGKTNGGFQIIATDVKGWTWPN
jgi:hypothetical protein